jgi:hypothetical protein
MNRPLAHRKPNAKTKLYQLLTDDQVAESSLTLLSAYRLPTRKFVRPSRTTLPSALQLHIPTFVHQFPRRARILEYVATPNPPICRGAFPRFPSPQFLSQSSPLVLRSHMLYASGINFAQYSVAERRSQKQHVSTLCLIRLGRCDRIHFAALFRSRNYPAADINRGRSGT